MQLSRISIGDIVKIDKKGRIFLAYVENKEAQAVSVKPLERNITYFSATAREVIGHFKKIR